MKKVLLFAVLITLFLTSCRGTRDGYGCHGRSKYITGHRDNGFW